MRIQAGREFSVWFNNVKEAGGPAPSRAGALLAVLRDLPGKPTDESASLKHVRQARRHEIWRVTHPYDLEVAVRILCWFPDDETAVVAPDRRGQGRDQRRLVRLGDTPSRSGRRPMDTTARGRGADMTKGEFTDITDEVDALLAAPELAAKIAEHRAEMIDADRRYAMGLAERLGVSQANIAKIEKRSDLLVSTLHSYLGALGGDVRIVVSFQGREIEVTLDALKKAEA